MRKLWYAGAVAAGGILFGAGVPAQADVRPETGTAEQPAAEQLADLAGQPNRRIVENPLRDTTIGGLLPSGGTSSLLPSPAPRQTELFDGGLPLLGGLGGLPPSNTLPQISDVPDMSGLPAGGIAVVPAVGEPATTQPTKEQPEPAVTLFDPRLHEEPTAPAATPSTEPRREFSPNGRPVAGIDQQYK